MSVSGMGQHVDGESIWYTFKGVLVRLTANLVHRSAYNVPSECKKPPDDWGSTARDIERNVRKCENMT